MAESRQATAVGNEADLQAELEKTRAELEKARAEAAEARAEHSRAAGERAELARALEEARRSAERQAARKEEQAMQQLRRQKKVLLTIASTPDDSTPVHVSINGYAYRIPRDIPTPVPEAVAEAVRLAAMDVPMVERQENGQDKTTFRHVSRFPFTIAPLEPAGQAAGTDGAAEAV